jgi:hypothetical protein
VGDFVETDRRKNKRFDKAEYFPATSPSLNFLVLELIFFRTVESASRYSGSRRYVSARTEDLRICHRKGYEEGL